MSIFIEMCLYFNDDARITDKEALISVNNISPQVSSTQATLK